MLTVKSRTCRTAAGAAQQGPATIEEKELLKSNKELVIKDAPGCRDKEMLGGFSALCQILSRDAAAVL